MALKSTPARYGTMAIAIHWVSAVLIIGLIASGLVSANSAEPAVKAAILRLHVPVALVVLGLTAVRLLWWWRFDAKPRPVAGLPRRLEQAARAVHRLFYVVIIAMLASGIVLMAVSGAIPIVFGGESSSLPDFWKFLPRIPHRVGAYLLAALLALHVGAAVWHHFARGDDVLRRMWIG